MTDFEDRTVLITGAASGIGRALAELLAAEGAHIILWDIDGAGLSVAANELQRRGGRVTWYECDLASREDVAATAKRVQAEVGAVDILINNAGVVTGKPLTEATDAEIRAAFDVNVLAHFWTVRAFLPAMLERDAGHIVTVASAGGLVGTARLTDYCASIFAAVGFDESLRLELRRRGSAVRTTVVCPFYVKTGMFAGVRTRFPRLLPILEPAYVAARIAHAIRRNKRRLLMPRLVYLALLLRWLPPRAFDALMDFFGVNASMDAFTGRKAR